MKVAELLFTNIAELFKVKSLITLTIIYAVTKGFLNGLVGVETYGAFAGSVITYYFLRKEKKEQEVE